MLDRRNPYYRQIELLVRVLPLLEEVPQLALKGGTALNLFVQDLPRLSVDIDLVYVPRDPREIALPAIAEALEVLAGRIEAVIRGASVNRLRDRDGWLGKLQVSAGGVQIKLEVSPVLRGTVLEVGHASVRRPVEETFGFAEVRMLQPQELYAGKLVAALDRQHPRDLFDLQRLMEQQGITPELMDLFVIYLASSSRPMAELLDPRPAALGPVFEQQFRSMALVEVSVDQLEELQCCLPTAVRQGLTDDQKEFLLSFKAGEPEWPRLVHPDAETLPAVQWKLHNIRRLAAGKRAEALAKLRAVLRGAR